MKHDIKLYIFDDDTHEVVEYTAKDKFPFWGAWMKNTNRQLAHTVLQDGDIEVSTMFLGIDQWPCIDGPPKPFETKVWEFGECVDVTRTETWDEALDAHKEAVRGDLL
jgi:hypothetical protein